MKYKITALKDVTIRCKIPTQAVRTVGGQTVMVPSEYEDWITLRAGEVRENLGLPLGVHPRCVPNEQAINIPGGVSIVMGEGWGNEELPKEFFGLYKLELES